MDNENFRRVVKVPTCKVWERGEKTLSRKKSQSLSRHGQGGISCPKLAVTAAKLMTVETAKEDQKRRPTFLDVVSKSYPEDAAGLPRRFSQCDLLSASDEFKSVMEDLKTKEETKEDLNTTRTALSKRSKHCQVFFGCEEKCNVPDLSSEYQRPRRRLYTFPARISEMRVLTKEDPLRTKEKETHSLLEEMGIHSNIKLAWQNGEKVKRNISLPNPSRGFYFKNTREGKDLNQRITTECGFQRDIITAPRIVSDKLNRRDIRPKISSTEMLESEKGVAAAALNKRSMATFDETKGNVRDAAGKMNRGVFIEQRLRGSDNLSSSISQKERTPSNAVDVEFKRKSSRFFSDDCYSRIRNLPVNLRANSENWQQPQINRGSSRPSNSCANLRRLGTTALVTTRLLNIHYRQNTERRNTLPKNKTLKELFEDIKDCRYLRKGVSICAEDKKVTL